jgi:hypothetical protein
MKHKMQVTTTTTKPQMRTSNSSVVRFGFWLLDVIDFLLQDRGYQVLRALLGKQALRFLTLLSMEVIRVLAKIPVPVFAAC